VTSKHGTNSLNSEPTTRLQVGGFDLEIGATEGTSASPARAATRETEPELDRALGEAEDAAASDERPAGAVVADAVDEAADVTEKAERASELFQKLARDRTLDPMDFRPEIDALLDRLAGLDQSGRLAEALRLARALEKLLALVRRWQALGRTLAIATRSAQALHDEPALAWAQHELGTFQLAAGDAMSADCNLSAARGLRERLGDHAGLRVTQNNLQALCHELRQELRDGRLRRTERRGLGRVLALPVAAGVALLMAGGVAGAVIGGGGDSTGDDGPGQTNATGPGETEKDRTETTGPASRHRLDVAVGPRGSVRSRSGEIDCPGGPCSTSFEADATTVLVATGDPGFQLESWGGDCRQAPRLVCEVLLSHDRRVTARFAEIERVTATLFVGVSSANLSVASKPEGILCPGVCTLTQPVGTLVSLTATPTGEVPGAGLLNWGGACAQTPSDVHTCGLTLDRNAKASVGYETAPAPAPTTTTAPPGGTAPP